MGAPSRYQSVIEEMARWELAPGDAGYPEPLLDLGDEAPVLHGYGDPSALLGECISIIGARKASPYGKTCAKMAGRAAAECGITVVSGGAVGCDQCAGNSALDAGGKTVVIPGCGADRVYPSSSDELFARAVSHGGCVVSLEHWGAPPARYTFVRRNNVIAALSSVLVVCEAGRPSGTFHTATKAAELGRKVYAVPGSIIDEESLEGLIALDYGRLRLQVESHDLPRGKLLDALVASPMRADEISVFLGLGLPQTLAVLAEQEALGLVCRLPDARFAPTEAALVGHNVGS